MPDPRPLAILGPAGNASRRMQIMAKRNQPFVSDIPPRLMAQVWKQEQSK